MTPRDAVVGLTDAELRELVTQRGGKPFQARQLAHWVYKHGAADFEECRNLPNGLLDALAETHAIRATRVVETANSDDTTRKLLIELADGETIETVIIPEGERTTLCISTQVGCPVGCAFCASGLFGVRRNLTAGEIVEQVLHARDRLDAPLTNLVVMGIGEPLLNLGALLPALNRIHDADGINMGARRITVSTSGYPRQMRELAQAEHAYNLAVSLHAADEELRARLVPNATSAVDEIVAAARDYFDAKGREVTFEIVLLDGVNDRRYDADILAERIRGFPSTVNLIPWNPVPDIDEFERPDSTRVDDFASRLRERGANVTVRRQRGADRSAACGQLRITHSAKTTS